MPARKIVTSDLAMAAKSVADVTCQAQLFQGDCVRLLNKLPNDSVSLTVTSPPYCMNKEYEDGNDVASFIDAHNQILPEIVRVTKPGGSICWQVGFHVADGAVMPLDYLVHDIMSKQPGVHLRNRIVWTYGHGLHCTNRFSGRYEVVMWYTKGDDYHFDLDAVRVRQKYPGKLANKGPKKGLPSGNPKGKNPSDIWQDIQDDVWEIPNVKANHVEKTDHPCQYPTALVVRLIRALCPAQGVVFDPFAGSGSAGVAALLEKRRFLGAEINKEYVDIAEERLQAAMTGQAKYRPLEQEIYVPSPGAKVAMKPEHFWTEPTTS